MILFSILYVTSRSLVVGSENQLEWYHKNYLDHVYAVSDDNANILEHYRYTAFGEVEVFDSGSNQIANTAINNSVTWNSRRYDNESGLHYYKYRHYKADIGRWLGRDPIEEDGGYNLYCLLYTSPSPRDA